MSALDKFFDQAPAPDHPTPAPRFPTVREALRQVSEERDRLREELRQSQRLECAGRLLGGVAHDFNNLLTAILGYSHLALRRGDLSKPAARDLNEVRKAAGLAANLTQRLLAVTRKTSVESRLLDPSAVVADMEGLLRRVIGEDVELIVRLGPHCGQVKVDPGQLEQVLMNLVVNARDAMPVGGRIEIETREHVNGNGPEVVLAVTDSGEGMPPEVVARMFEPFFTTKEAGKGTGLGLSIVQRIVAESGGRIAVHTASGQGTRFEVFLPCQPGVAGMTAKGPLTREPNGVERILLVEDDPMVADLVQEILTGAGYLTLLASDQAGALALATNHAGRLDLLMADLVLPGANGREVHRQLAVLHPGLKVLYMSGYADERSAERAHPGVSFIRKPFLPGELLERVRQVLDGPQPPKQP